MPAGSDEAVAAAAAAAQKEIGHRRHLRTRREKWRRESAERGEADRSSGVEEGD